MINELLRKASTDLARAGIDTPRLDAEVLCAHALNISRDQLYMDLKRELTPDEISSFLDLINRRKRHEPVAYITGTKEFMSMSFEVNPHTLIPRPETELLVEEVIKALKAQGSQTKMEVIEIGTGCGNIAISLARHLDCVVYATDISMEALRVASRNAKRLGVKEKIHLICGRLFLPFKEVKVDAILSNPPYIPTSEWEGLPLDVRGFEPRVALDGGLDGLDLHRDIIKRAPHYLKDGGLLALEIGFDQSTKIIKILEDYNWSSPSIIRDHKGLPRLILASKAHFC